MYAFLSLNGSTLYKFTHPFISRFKNTSLISATYLLRPVSLRNVILTFFSKCTLFSTLPFASPAPLECFNIPLDWPTFSSYI